MSDQISPAPPSPPADPWGGMPSGPPPAPSDAPGQPWGAPPQPWDVPPQPWGAPPQLWGAPPDQVVDPRRWGMGDILWGLAVVLLASTLFTIPLVVTGSAGDAVLVTLLGALGTWAGFGGWPLYCSWVKGLGSLRADFNLRIEWYDLFIGVGAAFGALLVNGVLGYLESQAGTQPESNTQILSDAKGSTWGVILVALIAVIGAPIFEELFFRGLTFGAVEKRFNRWAGFGVSTILFTLLHAQPADTTLGLVLLLVHIGVIGATLGLLRLITGRLGPSIVAHMTVNGLATLVVLSGAFGG